MESAATASVDFHFDPMCPFAYQTSLWVREVRRQTGLTISWRFFSLEEVNRFEGKKHPWQREWSYGWSLMRIGAILRRRSMDELDRWYARVGAELHEYGGSPHVPERAKELLADIGAPPNVFDEALADESTHDEIRTEHQRVIDAGGFGVPTLFFADQALFGPVLVDPPQGEEALRLWDMTVRWLEFPHVYEVQRLKGPKEHARIGEVMKPYLRGRDWQSVDRGKVIEFEEDSA